jgi:hypothetical protein
MRRPGVESFLPVLVCGVVWLASPYGCSIPDRSFDSPPSDASSESSATEAGSDSSATDASSDGSAIEASGGGPPAPVLVGSSGAKSFATGYGYQLHTIFAKHDGEYWFFYVDDTPEVIQTMVSRDLAHWESGGTIALAPGYSVADGYGFSVAYADLGGTDVVHIVANSVTSPDSAEAYTTFHIRATIHAGKITSSDPFPLPDTAAVDHPGWTGGSTCPEAGPATIVQANGYVWDVTAWTGHLLSTCDTNIYLSPAPDTGTTWSAAPFNHDGYFDSVPSYNWSHTLIDIPDANLILALWTDEDQTSWKEFDSIDWAFSSSFDGGGGPNSTPVLPDASAELFAGTMAHASYDDWTACRIADGSIHVVRHVTDPSSENTAVALFEEETLPVGATWQATAFPPMTLTSYSNTGVVLLSDANPADGLLMGVIGTDNAVNIFKRTVGGWSASPVAVIPGSVARHSLAGSGCLSAHPVVFWTEGAQAPFTVMSMDVSYLLGP